MNFSEKNFNLEMYEFPPAWRVSLMLGIWSVSADVPY